MEAVSNDLVVLHATDPATVFLSVSARMADVSVADVEAALFERRTMHRTLAMRRTLFVVTSELAPAVEHSSSTKVASTERKRLEQFLVDSDIADPTRWLAHATGEVLAVLDDHPDGLTARALTKAVPRLATRIVMGAGTSNPVEAGVTSRLLGQLAVEGRIIRGRPTGDWTTRQYRWHRRDRWWPDGRDPSAVELDESGAAARLLEHWLDRFGPATLTDMKWWTGWTMTKTRHALADIDVVEVGLDGDLSGETGFVLRVDEEPVSKPDPWAALLPSLDPTPMGWKQRGWFLGDHGGPLYDRSGNIGPTVWVDGRIVGGWSQRPDGELVTELLEPVGAEHRALIGAEAERVAAFVGDVVVRPSFPTPLQRQLSAGEG